MWAEDIQDYVDSLRSAGRPPIKDEYTEAPGSRQNRWQLRKIKKGGCIRCGKNLTGIKSRGGETKYHCVVCSELKRRESKKWHRKQKKK